METCSSASSTHRNFYFWKILNSRFLAEFQSFIFGQILAVLGSFGQILLHWQWLTACPNLGWNLKNLITFEPWVQTIRVGSHWKATIHIYNLKKFQKIQKFIAFTSACPESLYPTYECPKPLGVKSLFIMRCNRHLTSKVLEAIFQAFLKPLWMQCLSKKSQIFGEHVV
jgi:hypothetical protein